MSLVTVDELAARWGLERSGLEQRFVTDCWGMASLVRREIDRCAVATTREVVARLLPLLVALGEDEEAGRRQIKEVLRLLADLKELERGSIRGQTAWLKSRPRWIRLGPECAAVIGTVQIELIGGEALLNRAEQLVRWFNPNLHNSLQLLAEAEIAEMSLAEWIERPAWLPLADQTQPSDTSLQATWHHYCHQLEQYGEPFGGDRERLRVIDSTTNNYFGSPAEEPQGRWIYPDRVSGGTILGALRGYSEVHWRPVLVSVDGTSVVKTYFLPDWDTFNWLLLARGFVEGPEERVVEQNGVWHFTFPLPQQIQRLLRLMAIPVAPWKWSPAPGADQDLWRIWHLR